MSKQPAHEQQDDEMRRLKRSPWPGDRSRPDRGECEAPDVVRNNAAEPARTVRIVSTIRIGLPNLERHVANRIAVPIQNAPSHCDSAIPLSRQDDMIAT